MNNQVTLDVNDCTIMIVNNKNNKTTTFKNVASLKLTFNDRKCLFIRPIHNGTSLQDVGTIFERYGTCDIVLKKGFGFVTYDDERDAKDALELNGKLLNERRLSVSFSNKSKQKGLDFLSREESLKRNVKGFRLRFRLSSLEGRSKERILSLTDLKYEKRKMYLYNLPKDTRLGEIKDLCERFGYIIECKELCVRELRNNCYSILYEDSRDTDDAIRHLNETKFGGNFMFAQKSF